MIMKKYFKEFLLRGMMFSGLGPIVLAVIYLVLSQTVQNFSLSGGEAFTGILSTYLLAFVHAGASVFNQIEHWSVPKSLLCHFTVLYAAYALCYVSNSWIPFVPGVLVVFTAIFVAVYFAVWITVYLCVRRTSRRLNGKLS